MNEVRSVRLGMVRRIFSTDFRKISAPAPRFMRLSTEDDACCNGTSTYEQIFSWRAIVSSSLPEIFNLCQPLQQQGEPIFQTEVFAVAGGVLSYERDLAHATGGKALCFSNDRFKMARAKLAAQLRNDAEAARMVTAFSNLDVSRRFRRGQHAGRSFVVKVIRQVGNGAVPFRAGESSALFAGNTFSTSRHARLQSLAI